MSNESTGAGKSASFQLIFNLTIIFIKGDDGDMHPAPRRRVSRAATAVLAVGALALTACSSTGEAAEDAGLDVVTSTAIWGDVAEAVLTDQDAEVHAIVEARNVDPHSFEPAAADLVRASEADLVVVGGGGYDAWLYRDLAEGGDGPEVIHALPLAGHDHSHDDGHDHDHDHESNEHIWYDTEAVAAVASDLAAAVTALDPEAEVDAQPVIDEMAALAERVAALPDLRVAQTETIADYLVADSGMKDVTPESYRSAALRHTEPA
ncbi:MAG: zinc ABC transporter substrate-binding protein, partial [Corynebacterium sp.]|nr:zinc ABC transporter substrate-binding protein [Corynebacterium sp.]